jgi:hypothetical protein
MFHIPRVNVVESDTGFSVALLGRTGLKYQEFDKVLLAESEILMTDVPTVAIWKDCIQSWQPPHDLDKITEEKRTEIVIRICAALKWNGWRVEIHSEATGWVQDWGE